MTKTVLTYGTFDLFHIGHLKLLERLRAMGDRLIVGVSTDEFNSKKNKSSFIRFRDRLAIVQSLKCVDAAFPEEDWEQKVRDIKRHNVDVFGMGDDWVGKFDFLNEYCAVVYIPRTPQISSTEIRTALAAVDREHVAQLKKALDIISGIVEKFD